MVALNLLVIRCADIGKSADFYRHLGLVFGEEQHGNGPRHFSAMLGDVVLEIYPLGKRLPTKDVRLGFIVESLESILRELGIAQPPGRTEHGLHAVIEDPDGHKIELVESEV